MDRGGGSRRGHGLASPSYLALAALTLLAAGACGSEETAGSSAAGSGPTTCIPGAQVACACPGGSTGLQLCLPDGTLGLCECADAGSGGGAGATGGSGGSSAGNGGDGGSAGTTDPTGNCPRGLSGPSLVEITAPGGEHYCIDSTEVTKAQYEEFMAAKAGDTTGQPALCASNTRFEPWGPDSGSWQCVELGA